MSKLLSWFHERPLRMVWKAEKPGRRCYLIGTAHFFPYSFARSIRSLLQPVEVVLFEGPLDEQSMQRVADYGRQPAESEPDPAAWTGKLDPAAICKIDHLLGQRLDGGAQNDLNGLLLLGGASQEAVLLRPYFNAYIQGVRPWMAFFSIWSTCLGWEYSVDMQAYQVARRLGKKIGFLESIDEQLRVLDGIPLERIVRQLNDVHNWKTYKDRYARLYLHGDMQNLLAMSERFPTRAPVVIGERDAILFHRLKAVIEVEAAPVREAAVFLGIPHIPGVSQQLLEDGYCIEQVRE